MYLYSVKMTLNLDIRVLSRVLSSALRTFLVFLSPVIFSTLCFSGCQDKENHEIRNDFKKYYDKYNVRGSFVFFDEQKNKFLYYNEKQCTEPFSPASTFKILNSLIGLETGVIKDIHFVLPWDSIKRNEVWDKNHDLKSAFSNSVVWYYQELARRVGFEEMKKWLYKSNYGNNDMSGGVDKFWLSGGLQISPKQQIEFLRRFYNYELPFKKKNIDIVKEIMVVNKTADFVLSAKTGWGVHGQMDVGWYVGYLENNNNIYYFANCVQMDSILLANTANALGFDQARKEIVHLILNELDLINGF
ncbi:MAG: class D beta-lactamase [Saprospiraceae bacterium]|nr:class D beta-lactamase [Saprospiraceae bacterium]